jgi:hypothetical protein
MFTNDAGHLIQTASGTNSFGVEMDAEWCLDCNQEYCGLQAQLEWDEEFEKQFN